jgi:hypothetical protein
VTAGDEELGKWWATTRAICTIRIPESDSSKVFSIRDKLVENTARNVRSAVAGQTATSSANARACCIWSASACRERTARERRLREHVQDVK